MRRYILRKGDRSTSGGLVTEGIENCTDHGVPITYLGAEVWCNGCKTVGHIGPKGPRRPASMHGKQQALDGDICLCKCTPPPVIRASQEHSYHSFEAHELAELGFAPNGRPLPIQTRQHNEQFTLKDSKTGQPLANLRYRIRFSTGRIVAGLTDSKGQTQRVVSERAEKITLEIQHS